MSANAPTTPEATVPAGYPAAERSWGWTQYFALLGGLALIYQGWTYAAWLADGPSQLTLFRDTSASAWVVARIFEGLVVIVGIVILAYVVRQCLAQRRLTFDAMTCLAGVSVIWLDPMANFAQPLFFYSSDWVNLNSWCGNVPFRLNPSCGAVPQPVLFDCFLYPFCMLGIMIVTNAIMRAAHRRWPSITPAKLVVLAFFCTAGLGMGMQVFAIFFHLWAFPNLPMSLFGQDIRYPLVDILGFSGFFTSMAALRFFKDDKGQTFVERGLDHLAPRVRRSVAILALIGYASTSYVLFSFPDVWAGAYADHFAKDTPAHIVNGVCDTHEITGTAYGPCPGMPGYRIPSPSP
jgi:Spirocyclase AveC-like